MTREFYCVYRAARARDDKIHTKQKAGGPRTRIEDAAMAGSRKRLLWYVDSVEGARPRPGRPPAQSHMHMYMCPPQCHTPRPGATGERPRGQRLCAKLYLTLYKSSPQSETSSIVSLLYSIVTLKVCQYTLYICVHTQIQALSFVKALLQHANFSMGTRPYCGLSSSCQPQLSRQSWHWIGSAA